MGNIRKQTIVSSILIYLGFLVGAFNIYMYTRNGSGSFLPEQYALTRVFFDFSQIMLAFGAVGVMPVVYKFYPYYADNLDRKKIDLFSWALLLALVGMTGVLLAGWYFKSLFIRKYSEHASLLVDYYFWLFPCFIGLLFFSVSESLCWALNKSVFSNFLKETLMRLITTVLIFLFFFRVISFTVFISLFSFQYFAIFLILLIYVIRTGKLRITFSISKVTRKFWKKMVSMQLLIFGGTIIAAIASTVDSLIIASLKGLETAGVFVFAQYTANLIQVPQRSITSISAGVLSRAWKDKNYKEINRIYSRSCINLLLMALFIFGNVWLNIVPGMKILDIQNTYSEGLGVFFVLGMYRILDAGTGLNQMVINTSTFWKFDFFSGLILLGFRLPLTYFLIHKYGIIGSAFAELTAYGIYNFIRYEFLRRKFNMQPFNLKTLYSILLAVVAYGVTYFLVKNVEGWTGIILRAGLFSALMIAGVFYWKLTPDAGQLYEVFLKRIEGFRKKD
jgi:O-antigen/teichoic acid export membrane protein